MQIVSSLLDLEGRSIDDERARRLLRGTQSRVRSMALIHEQLYRAPDLARIDFREFVRALADHLAQAYGLQPDLVTLKVNVEPVLMPVDKAIPLGLIVNELVSNALKYAFPEGRHGEVHVDFSQKDDRFILTVWDSGIGLARDFDIKVAQTLGLQLVNALTTQGKGTLEVHSDGGAEFRLVFPV